MVLPYGVVPIGPQPSLSPFPAPAFVNAPVSYASYAPPPMMAPPMHHGYDYPTGGYGERDDYYDDEREEPYYDDYQDHVERSRSPRRPFEGTPADPRSRSPVNQRRGKSPVTNRVREHGEEDAFSLALSEITTIRPEHLYMTLPEEMMLLKAGDNPKFSKKNKVMDQQCAAALLLELVWQGRVGPDPHFSVDPQRLVLKVLDDTPTGSKLVDSAISNLKRKPKHPPTVAWWLEKASPDLAASILWRLVKKNKVTYDPRTFGADRYPIKSFADLNAVRERVVQAVDQRLPAAVRDMFLAFLYYLPEDSSEKVFGDREDNGAEDGRLLGKALVFAMRDNTRGSKNWI